MHIGKCECVDKVKSFCILAQYFFKTDMVQAVVRNSIKNEQAKGSLKKLVFLKHDYLAWC